MILPALLSVFFLAPTVYSSVPIERPLIALEAHYTPTVISQPLTIEEKIIAKADEYHYSTTTAWRIAKAESNFVPTAHNASSTASGLFQFLDGTFNSYCIKEFELTDTMDKKNDPDIQIECAVKMLAEGQESHWIESSPNKKGW